MENRAKLAHPAQQISLFLPEWTVSTPQSIPALVRFSFDEDPAARHVAQRLTQSGQITFNELSSGLEIRTTSVVGSIRLGRLSLTIIPKINGLPLMRLLRFAYKLRNLELFNDQVFNNQQMGFQDLLILQLIEEVKELFARGLLRRYVREEESLSSPIGRVDFKQFARQGGLVAGKLPCVYYHRLENCLHNQVILSGLLFAAQLTDDLILRSRARRLAQLLNESIHQVDLNMQTLKRVERESDRMTDVYSSAIKLIALLLGKQGLCTDEETEPVKLKGFLFDMNRFFQALLSRLLHNHLDGYKVEDERQLKGFLSYVPGFELPTRQDPLPRPDFAIFEKGKTISLFDAKYRDLWQRGIPRDMLYQLIVYALSQPDNRTATILYPSMDAAAKEAKIQVNEPIAGTPKGYVILRPVNLKIIEKMIVEKRMADLNIFTHHLAFG